MAANDVDEQNFNSLFASNMGMCNSHFTHARR